MKEAKWKDFSKDEIEQFVKESCSYASLSRKLGYGNSGSSIVTVKAMVQELNLDVSHFTGQGWLSGKTYDNKRYIPFAEYIKSKNVATSSLSKKILKEGLKERRCECCKNTMWNGEPIPLELHHIDGDTSNNELDNLQLLCPNCHALTDNYCGKNVKRQISHINDDDFDEALKNSSNIKQALNKLGLTTAQYYYRRAHKLIDEHNIVFEQETIANCCIDCGKPISQQAERCNACNGKLQRHVDIPSREDLKNLIRTTSFLQIGKQYGVSDNAIRKWCKKYHLPSTHTEIKK